MSAHSTRSVHSAHFQVPPTPERRPVPTDGTALYWSPLDGRWVVFQAPCRDCGQIAPIITVTQACASCTDTSLAGDEVLATRPGGPRPGRAA